jgi:hypothetical protein
MLAVQSDCADSSISKKHSLLAESQDLATKMLEAALAAKARASVCLSAQDGNE